MDSVKKWQLIKNNCDDTALNFASSPKYFATCLKFEILKLIFTFSPSARWCMGSHLMNLFQFALVVQHVVTLPTLLSRAHPLDIPSFLEEYLQESFLDLDIPVFCIFQNIQDKITG